MRRIEKIVWTTKKPPKTYVLLDGGNGDTVYVGYKDKFEVGDRVEAFHDAKWDVLKIRHSKPPKEPKS